MPLAKPKKPANNRQSAPFVPLQRNHYDTRIVPLTEASWYPYSILQGGLGDRS